MTRSAPARALLWLLALTMVCAPFYGAWRYNEFRRSVTAQEPPPRPAHGVSSPAPGAPAGGARAGSRARSAAPVVLAYHDIGRDSRSRYTVTPEAFDAQLGALAAAGYRTLSSAEFVAYLRGGRAPGPRSVFLTFDDGAHGLWVHGDRILAKYRMRAAAFLITRAVGSHRPYYLSWEEIGRMARSGRWDFENHTHDLHQRSPVDASGNRASALTSRLWLSGGKRRETEAEYRRRVEADLDRSIGDITRHGLPAPRLFAYPFSEANGRNGSVRPTNRTLRAALDARFAAALTNSSDRPLPAGRRAAAAREVQRVEVTRRTDVRDLLTRVERWTAVSPGACPAPLAEPLLWRRSDRTNATGLGALTGTGPYPRGTAYAAASYRPTSTADWSAYTVDARADRLRESENNVGLVVRDGSRDPLAVALSLSHVRLLERRDGRWREVTRRRITAAAEHRVRVTVDGDRTVVVVDGGTRIERLGTRVTGGDATGGFALSVRNGDPAGAWPRFTSLTVGPPAREKG
ncbi:polysaccharide deacetylase family protein [Streptomyces sp. NBC_00059]|uniref:polysaccharide deacetylase family protein n=1 Tax=Streptomyces sp. NBC_00059 TaxID=2975635 RepID=UPI00224DF8F9|nr:polysaccharide deacetylase family protein [Streptomyces sp. NBC_00059]MCX5417433.1 polysaccharide deacetylase family protein [Streptomyces sp. NBC_00059]